MVSRFSLICAAALAAVFVTNPAQSVAQAAEAGIKVILNNAKVVKLSRPATTVIIGNPEIADATVQDSQTLVLTGRGFGRTNLVILDATGTPILDEQVAVARDSGSTLRVYRRAAIENLSCEPECEGAYLTEAETQAIAATNIANNAGEAED
ncbi:MAG: pilus assembly protein N-terminal domain-containing protein [Pseudomonadota bacterium]